MIYILDSRELALFLDYSFFRFSRRPVINAGSFFLSPLSLDACAFILPCFSSPQAPVQSLHHFLRHPRPRGFLDSFLSIFFGSGGYPSLLITGPVPFSRAYGAPSLREKDTFFPPCKFRNYPLESLDFRSMWSFLRAPSFLL